MNIRNIKTKFITFLIGVGILGLWIVYATLTNFDFVAFFTNPTILFIGLLLAIPFSFIISDKIWGDK